MMRVRKSRHTRGGRNLMILGVLSTLVALVTTSVALAIYHNSGDIYLDRSRPGYLPDEEEVRDDEEIEEEYDFKNIDKLDASTIEDYLKHIQEEAQGIEGYYDAFSDEALSNEKLIQKMKVKES